MNHSSHTAAADATRVLLLRATAVSTGKQGRKGRSVDASAIQGRLKRKFGIGQGMSKNLLMSALGSIEEEKKTKKK